MSAIIRVQGVSKRFRLGVIDRALLYEGLRRFWRAKPRPDPAHSELWALKDISFDVRAGDVLGVIGRNGSGKSTLLKILSQITAPTEGRVLIKGKVASLLEVGTGFHNELTGRDNIFLNGAVLGMSRRETAAKFDEIVAFSQVEEFIDTPVKHYSSGMRVRLAFAVAAHLDPEILIIDEVLAVGDATFQQKCIGKISDVARAGRTVLFVSHNAAAVESLCTRGIVLDHGRLLFEGTQTDAIGFYAAGHDQQAASLRDRTDRTGSGEVRIVGAEIRDTAGHRIGAAQSGQDVEICLFYERNTPRSFPRLNARISLTTQLGAPVFTQSNQLMNRSFESLPERGVFICKIPQLPLPAAAYRVEFQITTDYRNGDALDLMQNAFELPVENGDFFGSGQVPSIVGGVCLVRAQWRVEADDRPGTEPTSLASAGDIHSH